jgi:hypothetical protein
VAGVWRSDVPTNLADQLGFAEGLGMTTVHVTKEARLYAGNFVRVDSEALYTDIAEETTDKVVGQVNNPTDQAIGATTRPRRKSPAFAP